MLVSSQMVPIQFGQRGQFALLLGDGDARAECCASARARLNERPLMAARQKIGGPDLPTGIRQMRCEDNERRQVAVGRAQPVADPARRGSVEPG